MECLLRDQTADKYLVEFWLLGALASELPLELVDEIRARYVALHELDIRVRMVIDQTSCEEKVVRDALHSVNYDIVDAIMLLCAPPTPDELWKKMCDSGVLQGNETLENMENAANDHYFGLFWPPDFDHYTPPPVWYHYINAPP